MAVWPLERTRYLVPLELSPYNGSVSRELQLRPSAVSSRQRSHRAMLQSAAKFPSPSPDAGRLASLKNGVKQLGHHFIAGFLRHVIDDGQTPFIIGGDPHDPYLAALGHRVLERFERRFEKYSGCWDLTGSAHLQWDWRRHRSKLHHSLPSSPLVFTPKHGLSFTPLFSQNSAWMFISKP